MERPVAAARQSGLVRAGEPLLVLLSGGADSVCLLDVCLRLEARVSALHVNYGLRSGADADEAHCRELCERLAIPLEVERARLDSAEPGAAGNVQAEARELRYALAERHAGRAGGDYATAHTASDQAETIVYRLAVSPGRRALLGMAPRRGRLVRPLLAASREETRAYCEARGLAWREDPSNADPRFARARLGHEVMPVLRELAPALERTIAETALLLRDESEVLEAAVDEAVERLGREAVPVAELRGLPAGLARLVLRRLAEGAAGEQRSLTREDVDAVLRLGERGGTQSLDLGGGLRAVVEYGTLRFARGADSEREAPPPATLPVPGSVRFGAWEVQAREAQADERAVGEEVFVAADRLGGEVTVRAWRAGDRMRPAGVGGSKSLQDLFVDRKVPRALRGTLPVVEARGEIAWVAGVAVGEGFVPGRERNGGLVALSARQAGG